MVYSRTEPNPNILEVRMLNSENNTYYFQYIRKDRLQAFYQMITENRQPGHAPKMPGLSGRAIAGLDAIFDRRPQKFPYMDILKWLRDEQSVYLGGYPNPTITVEELEDALERFSDLYPADAGA